MEYTFNIPSTCMEVVVIDADNVEDAIHKLKNYNYKETYIPESEYTISLTDDEAIRNCLLE